MSVIYTALPEHLLILVTGLELTGRATSRGARLRNAVLHILRQDGLDALPGRLPRLPVLIATAAHGGRVLVARTGLAAAEASNAARDLLVPTAFDGLSTL